MLTGLQSSSQGKQGMGTQEGLPGKWHGHIHLEGLTTSRKSLQEEQDLIILSKKGEK
jgi:hypothetical protein